MTGLAVLQELKAIRSLAERQLEATQKNNLLLVEFIKSLAVENEMDDPQDIEEVTYLNSRG